MHRFHQAGSAVHTLALLRYLWWRVHDDGGDGGDAGSSISNGGRIVSG